MTKQEIETYLETHHTAMLPTGSTEGQRPARAAGDRRLATRRLATKGRAVGEPRIRALVAAELRADASTVRDGTRPAPVLENRGKTPAMCRAMNALSPNGLRRFSLRMQPDGVDESRIPR